MIKIISFGLVYFGSVLALGLAPAQQDPGSWVDTVRDVGFPIMAAAGLVFFLWKAVWPYFLSQQKKTEDILVTEQNRREAERDIFIQTNKEMRGEFATTLSNIVSAFEKVNAEQLASFNERQTAQLKLLERLSSRMTKAK